MVHDPLLNQVQGQPVAFDLETRGSDRQWSDPPGTHVKLGSYAVGTHEARVTTGGPSLRVGPDHSLLDLLSVAGGLAGHNILNYDLPVLTRQYGFPTPWQLLEAGVVLWDTQLVENLWDPPEARWSEGEAQRYYKLDTVAQRRGFPAGKTLDLTTYAKMYDGFENIPWEDPLKNIDLLAYARQDAVLVRELVKRQRAGLSISRPDRVARTYVTREHWVAAIASQIMLNGFRVDEALLSTRIQEGQDKRAHHLALLRDKYGLPTLTADGKREAKAPQATKAGKEAILAAFVDAGLDPATFPRKEKSNAPDLSKDTMLKIIAWGANEQATAIAEVVMELNGVRTIYQQVQDYLVDGRVHPNISMRQASGRWSFTKPGLTVVGKRQGRVTEREVFLAEEGEVILTADLSQVDARAVAVFSQDEAYMALFGEGRDLWTELSERFGITRDAVKIIGHGANYGQGAKGVVKHNPSISYADAQRFHDERAEQFPGLMEWQNRVRRQAQNGELLDNGWGRKLNVNPDRAYTQGPALSGQSGARDIMMEGLLRLARTHPETLPMLRGVVHDEVVLSVPTDIAQDVRQAVESSLTFPWAPRDDMIPIQIKAEASIGGRTWASAYAKD